MVVAFGRFIGKPLQQNFFLVKTHSAISNNIKNAPHHICFLKLYSLSREPLHKMSLPKFKKYKKRKCICKILEKTCGISFLVKMQVPRPEKKLLKINVLHFKRFLQYRWKISEKVFIFQFYHSGISQEFCKSLYSKL